MANGSVGGYEGRQGPPQQARPANGAARPPAQAQARPDPLAGILGSFSDPSRIGEALRNAGQHFNLLGAATVGALPMGCEVAISAVYLSGNKDNGDVYDVGGRWGLSKPAIDKLAGAAGIVTVESTCLRFEKRYCEWRVTRALRRLDGSIRKETASRIIDLREGSQYLANLRAKARDKSAQDKQVNEILGMLGAHAETKARLRADRSLLGVRTYTTEDMAKPFVVPTIMFTGKTDDPNIRAMFALATAQSFLHGTLALYGGTASQQLPAFAQQQQPMPQMGGGGSGGYGAAPALGMGGNGGPAPFLDDDDVPADVSGPQAPMAEREPGPPIDWRTVKSAGDWAIPFGKTKGKKLSEIDGRDLAWWRKKLEEDIDNPEQAQYRAQGIGRLRAIYDLLRTTGEVTPLDMPPPAAGAPQGEPPPPDYSDADNDGR